jgi:hypothetical protein
MCDSSLQFLRFLLGPSEPICTESFQGAPFVLGHQRGGVVGAPVFLAGQSACITSYRPPFLIDRKTVERRFLRLQVHPALGWLDAEMIGEGLK